MRAADANADGQQAVSFAKMVLDCACNVGFDLRSFRLTSPTALWLSGHDNQLALLSRADYT